ncbi:condensation domain-containing protein, partial [Fulvivirga imtechensis]|uniref:condensation domain-containing protein n=1 Tax=Fulvivirga imtechensis TaxID=881893 RepID=UPI0012FC77B4
EKSDYQEIQPVPEQEYYDVSHGQKRIWLLYQMEEEQIAYNMPHAFSLSGPVNGQVLHSSLNILVDRHESLRTTFKLVDGEVKQYIHGSVEFDLEEYDWRGEEDRDTRVRALIESEATRVFDLEHGPLIIGRLVQLEDDHYVFTLTLHHIISDGWSNELLINELITIYSAVGQGDPVPLQPLRIHYKDYALWQHEQLHGENYEKHEQYWHDQFSGEIPVLELPADRVRPPVQTHRGASCGTFLDSEITRGLRQMSEKTGSSMFMCLLASVKAFLYRYTGQRDMIIGTPVAGRVHPSLDAQVGFYVNTLAIRTQFEGSIGFEDLLYKVKENVLSAFEHQVYPFDKLVDSLSLNRDMSRSPLFDVMVILQNAHSGQQSRTMEDVVVEELIPESESSKFDITFNYNEIKDGEELYLSLVYNPDLFNASRIERMLEHYKAMLTVLSSESQVGLEKLTFISEEERHQLLEVFNDTTAAYPEEKTIHQLIEEQVVKSSSKAAVIFDDRNLSYEELNRRSNMLAHLLCDRYGIASDDLIGLMVPRNEEMVV